MERNASIQQFVKQNNFEYSKYPLHRYLFNVKKYKFHAFVSEKTDTPSNDPVALFIAYDKTENLDYEYYQKYPDDLSGDLDGYFKQVKEFFPPVKTSWSDMFWSLFFR
jgi:hypothetical protein